MMRRWGDAPFANTARTMRGQRLRAIQRAAGLSTKLPRLPTVNMLDYNVSKPKPTHVLIFASL